MYKSLISLLIVLLTTLNSKADKYEIALPIQSENLNREFIAYKSTLFNKGWNKFKKENGDWNIMIDKVLETPHSAFGTPIGINIIDLNNEEEVKQKTLDFLVKNKELFNINPKQLKLSRIIKVRNNYYVNYKQFINGIIILGSDIELKLNFKGEVFHIEIDFYEINNFETKAIKSYSDAIGSLKNKLKLKSIPVLLSDNQKKYILPVRGRNSIALNLVYNTKFRETGTPDIYNTYINANTGKVVWNQLLTHNIIKEVEVGGEVEMVDYFTESEYQKMTNLYITIDNEDYLIDENGDLEINIDSIANYSFNFEGPWAKILWDSKIPTTVNGTISTENSFIELDNFNSNIWERNHFYYLNFVHDYIKDLDPEFTAMDTVINLTFDLSGDYGEGSNAFSNYDSIVFINPDNIEMALANGPSILYHEYGHSLNNLFYQQQGSNERRMVNRAANEGTADVLTALITDNPKVGLGHFREDKDYFIRNIDNENIYPDSLNGVVHIDGLILAGAFWDLRKLIGIEKTLEIYHFAKYGLPDDLDNGIAFTEWFQESLIADDDDGDLTNGTPNMQEILEAFNKHQIGSDLLIQYNFSHSPLENTMDTQNDFPLFFEISNLNSPGVDLIDPKLHYSIDDGKNYITVDAVFENNRFNSKIPAPRKSEKINYYFSIKNSGSSKEIKFPNFGNSTYEFLVAYELIALEDFEGESSWELGDDNNASDGVWEVANPNEVDLSSIGIPVILQPGEDASEIGEKCLVTGAEAGLFFDFVNYTSGVGVNSIQSPSYDLSDKNDGLILNFNYWYNGVFADGNNEYVNFGIYYSINNGEWEIFNTEFVFGEKWQNMTVRLPSSVFASDDVKFKFSIYNNPNNQQLIEGLIDDFKILSPIKPIKSVANNDSEFNIWQNKNNIIINYKEILTDKIELEIVDIHGNRLYKIDDAKSIGSDYIKLDLDELNINFSNGVYFLNVRYNGNLSNLKFIY